MVTPCLPDLWINPQTAKMPLSFFGCHFSGGLKKTPIFRKKKKKPRHVRRPTWVRPTGPLLSPLVPFPPDHLRGHGVGHFGLGALPCAGHRVFFWPGLLPAADQGKVGSSALLSSPVATRLFLSGAYPPSIMEVEKGGLWKTIFLLGSPFVHFHDCWKEGTS